MGRAEFELVTTLLHLLFFTWLRGPVSLTIRLQFSPEEEVKSFCQYLTKKNLDTQGSYLLVGARVTLKVPHLSASPCLPLPTCAEYTVHPALGGEAQGLGLTPALLLTSCVTTGKSLSLSEPPCLPLESGMIVLAQLTSQRASGKSFKN